MNFPGLSQDTSTTRIPVIEYNGELGLFLDSLAAVEIAHKLEDGDACAKELNYCDSSLYVADSINQTYIEINENLNRDLELSENENEQERDKTKIWEEKFNLADDQRKKARGQRWLWGGVGIGVGVLFGLLISK